MRSFLAGGVLVAFAVAILGLLIPNNHLIRVGFFWSSGWDLQLWVVMTVAIAGGLTVGALLGLLLWYRQRRAFNQCQAQRRVAEKELHELRRLLTQQAVGSVEE